jgi:hypothetical protein
MRRDSLHAERRRDRLLAIKNDDRQAAGQIAEGNTTRETGYAWTWSTRLIVPCS